MDNWVNATLTEEFLEEIKERLGEQAFIAGRTGRSEFYLLFGKGELEARGACANDLIRNQDQISKFIGLPVFVMTWFNHGITKVFIGDGAKWLREQGDNGG